MSLRNPIKVLHLASGDRWAGAEVQLFTLLTQLHQHSDIEPAAVLLNDGELAQRLREHRIGVDVVDENRLSSIAIFRKLLQLLRERAPQILHTHRQKENILGSIANRLSIRAQSLRTVHGASEYSAKRLSQRALRALDLWAGNHLQQRVIAVSSDLAAKLENDFKPEHIVTIENGVDIAAVRAAVKPADFRLAAPAKVHIGIVGRLDPVKRIDIFLAMALQLMRESPETAWSFHIFGEGKLDSTLKALAHTLQIGGAVQFHGHRRDITACLAGLDAVVMCSDHEGLPMTILEALAVGTPVLAHAVGGLNNVLADGAGGLLVREHSPTGYANALRRLLKEDRAQLHSKGICRLQERYSAEINGSRIAELYRQCLAFSQTKPR